MAAGGLDRDADLLYRAYRFVRLRRLGDTRPAASLGQSVEHQALVGLMAEQSGVHVPHVDRVARSSDGSALLAMHLVDGRSLDDIPGDQITDGMLGDLWADVGRLHQAGIAHRSLRTANVMVDAQGAPWLVDFSFSELAATDRQVAVDVAELLASPAVAVGPERAVDSAGAVIGPAGIAPAVPLLQPLALSAATRSAVGAGDDLLGRTRRAAAGASGESLEQLARVQRLAFGPTVLAQLASSFVNRVTPASIGGMVLNTRFLAKSGVEPATAIAGVGLNSVAGGIVHIGLLVAFFVWSKNALGGAFKLPSGSTALVVIAVVLALLGLLMVVPWGRRKVLALAVTGVRSSAANPAVSIVLTYRLATYWLPILPGWMAWTAIQRKSYI